MKFAIKKGNFKRIPYLVFLLLIFFLFSTLVLYKLQSISIKSGNSSKGNGSTNDSSKIDLPVDLKNKSITSFYVSYGFSGPVKELKKVEGGLEIVLEASGNGLPRFIVNQKDTKFSILKTDRTSVPTEMSNLKAGQNVFVSSIYFPDRKEWVTWSVNIYE